MGKFNHATALLIKFAALAVISAIALPAISTMTITESLITALVLTVAAYLIGDLWILPSFNNTAATVADAGIAFIAIWLMNSVLTRDPINLTGLLVISLVIAAAEYFFHKYVALTVTKEGETLAEAPGNQEEQ